MQRKLFGIITIDFEVLSYLLIIYCAFVKYLSKWEQSEATHQLFLGFKEAYDSVSEEVLYNTVTECVIPMNIEIGKKEYPNETYSRTLLGKHFFFLFPVKNGL
jgi:hypothetical protein